MIIYFIFIIIKTVFRLLASSEKVTENHCHSARESEKNFCSADESEDDSYNDSGSEED